jgi:uncharacterized protein
VASTTISSRGHKFARQGAQEPVQLFRYCDKQPCEIDVILEQRHGEIAGVEVKASATLALSDFTGLALPP